MDPIIEEQRVHIHRGVFDDDGSWVYVWRTSEGHLRYVGATGLPPLVRAWLHLNHDDPEVGRLRAQQPDIVETPVDVLAFRLADGRDRQQVKRALTALLAAEEPDASVAPGDIEAAVAIAARIAETS